jgi:hypothetical protein
MRRPEADSKSLLSKTLVAGHQLRIMVWVPFKYRYFRTVITYGLDFADQATVLFGGMTGQRKRLKPNLTICPTSN